MGLGGVINNLLSLGAKLLPAVTASAQAPSSSSSPPAETHQIEAYVEIFMKGLKQMKATLHDAEGREISDESVKLFFKELKVLDHSSAQAPSSSSSPPAETHQIEADLKSLMKMLEQIKATLYDAEARAIMEEAVKLWLRELRGVAYDAEDVLDEYHYEVLRVQVEARDASPPNPLKRKQVQIPDDMPDKIKQIKVRFDDICKDRIALRLSDEDGPRRCELQIAPASHLVVESDIFGREREKVELIDLLCAECDDGKVVSVVTIVGTGGLGKTTLAQLAYNDQRIRQRFDKFGWVCVSDDFNVQRLTGESVESITGSKCDPTNLCALQENIREVIRGKRVLLVLDDVWNEKRSLWESFLVPFRKSAALVKILVTTRNEPVAQIMQTVPTFNLGYLPEEQCWQLFQHYAFGEVNQNESSKFVEIGKQLMKKCGMLPLGVKSIASLLRHEVKEESWSEILESELWESDTNNEIFAPLQISYARLPTYLKPCFLYCSMFPKDYRFTVGELVPLWISQGYMKSNVKKDAKKIGREYAKQLLQRSFFEGRYEEEFDQAGFKLHDMVHDLARSSSQNGCYSIEAGQVPNFSEELYHLYVNGDMKHIEPVDFGKFTALRTLIIGSRVENFYSNFEFSKTQKLRALKLPCYDVELEFLSSVVHLKHLRHLSLVGLSLERLPECICSLYCLQNLIMSGCESLKELPKNIGNLVSLEELVIIYGRNLTMLPVSLCQLKALTNLELRQCGKLEELPNDIGGLTNLKTLHIFDCGLRKLPMSFCQLKALTELYLDCTVLEEFPNDCGSLTNLRTLTILCSEIKVLPVSLCQLKALTELLIRCDELEGLPNDIGSLTNLQTLKIVCCEKIRMLPASLCQLKALTELELNWCDELEELPNEIGSLTNLQTLEIYHCHSLTMLPMSLCQLKALTKLLLLGCEALEELPIDIGSLTNLQILRITHPNSVSSLPPGFSKFKGIQTLEVELSCGAIGCFKDFFDLVETLRFQGLSHRYQSELKLCQEEKNFVFVIKSHLDTIPDVNFTNLKKLYIAEYGGITFPSWIGNPISCASLERVVIEKCKNLTFLPFGSLCNLKSLVISQCCSLCFLEAESLPLELQELEIHGCGGLTAMPGIRKLKSLVKLRITQCKNLIFLVQSVELTLPRNESSYQNPSLGLANLTSLRSLQIACCPKLQPFDDRPVAVESYKVEVFDCPSLKEWCFHHSITYKDKYPWWKDGYVRTDMW